MAVSPSGELYVLNSGEGRPIEIYQVSPSGDKALVYTSRRDRALVGRGSGIAVIDEDHIFVTDSRGLYRVRRDGRVEPILSLPSRGLHGTGHIALGQDGKLYWGQGSATNSGIVERYAAWLKWDRGFHDIPCRDVVLSGVNYGSRDAFSDDRSSWVETGPFLPFGTEAWPGQVVRGELPCTSSIMRANLDGSGLQLVAWGFRNPFGLTFSPVDSPLRGALVVTNNGSDPTGARQIESDSDDLFIVAEGGWYGWPDYLDELPVSEARFALGDESPAGVERALQSPSRDEALSAVTHFEKGAAAAGLAFSSSDAFGFRNDAFVAIWGTFGQGRQALEPPGSTVYRVHFQEGSSGVLAALSTSVFARNRQPGKASQTGQNGLEHPVDVEFAPDGSTMYVLDFGTFGEGQPGSSRIWAIQRDSTAGAPEPAPPGPAGMPVAAPRPAPSAPPVTPAGGPAPAAVASVTLDHFAFGPQELTVAAGTTVTWTNVEDAPHSVTADDGAYDSGLFGGGESFSHTLTTPGTYGYYCIPHGAPGSGMFGTVVVTSG
jgi:plastocyanin/glucose/arabinose dehydrogenase